MSTNEFAVTGMSCGHCETSVRTEVALIDGVDRIDVSAVTGRLVVTTTKPVADQAVLDAVDEAGYQAVRV